MITNPVEKLNALYAKAEEQMPFFKRNLYEQAFDKYYQTNPFSWNCRIPTGELSGPSRDVRY